jgi:outer membrane lipoprotein SlyB
MQKWIRGSLALCTVLALGLQGCAYNSSSPDVYTGTQSQSEQTVRLGTVETVRAVKIRTNDGRSSGLGLIGGAAIGAVAGNTLGGGRGAWLTGIVGGIAGAVAGNAIENGIATKDGLEITVRLDDGDLRAITQESTSEIFQAGDRVRLLSSNGVTRITH